MPSVSRGASRAEKVSVFFGLYPMVKILTLLFPEQRSSSDQALRNEDKKNTAHIFSHLFGKKTFHIFPAAVFHRNSRSLPSQGATINGSPRALHDTELDRSPLWETRTRLLRGVNQVHKQSLRRSCMRGTRNRWSTSCTSFPSSRHVLPSTCSCVEQSAD